MGIDYKTCEACSKNFPDCGPHVTCESEQGGCGSHYCSRACARIEQELPMPEKERGGTDWATFEALSEPEQALHRMTCADCRRDLESPENLLEFLLAQLGMSREDLVRGFRDKDKKFSDEAFARLLCKMLAQALARPFRYASGPDGPAASDLGVLEAAAALRVHLGMWLNLAAQSSPPRGT